MGVIPNQTEGASSDIISKKHFDSEDQAKVFFILLKQRLLNVNQWKEYAGTLSATFQLCDLNGDEVQRNVEEGDYFKIHIPGPGSEAGEGFDWVKVELVKEENTTTGERLVIKVRPSSNPRNSKADIAHFFDDTATSTFIINRKNKKLTAEVHGRNEIPNTEADAFGDKLRNTVIATAAISGFSKIQWNLLTEGLLKDI
ncbi:MAG: hypothetical protein ABIW38_04810 [Ferruginibacter sp.]